MPPSCVAAQLGHWAPEFGSIAIELVWNVDRIELGHDFAAVGGIKAGEQQPHGGRGEAGCNEIEETDETQ